MAPPCPNSTSLAKHFPMSQNDNPPDRIPKSFSYQQIWWAFAAIGSIVMLFAIWRSPTYSFHPICTYTVNARVSADVEIADQKLSSTVIYQNSRSRKWLGSLNTAGCEKLYGTALTYRLANDSILIVPTRICYNGEQLLAKSGSLDILGVCTGKQAHQDSAFMVDSASRPTKWHSVTNGVDFRIHSMTAVSTWNNPADDIESTAPNLLTSNFKYGHQQWSRSPKKIISFKRRYQARRNKPDKSYQFEVNNERFQVE
jgi:hypothetical protein